MRTRTGYVYQDQQTGNWYARVCYRQNNGKRTSAKRSAPSKAAAKKALKQLLHTLENGGRKALETEKLTFNELCDYYTTHYLKPAQYVNGRKVAGLRSIATVNGYIKVFRDHFGLQKLSSIAYEDLLTFRSKRLQTSTHQSGQRSLATVNREMAYLRRLLNIAEQRGLIAKNPFRSGDSLIHVANETKRERIITRAEEDRLLAACTGVREHLRPILLAAIDTGCRMRELLKLQWRDVDLEAGLMTIQAFNTKTMRERQISLTSRLRNELLNLKSRNSTDSRVFGVSDVRASFRSACKQAKLDGLRFHDLRHTHATRLDDIGFSLAKIGAQLGHTQVQTTLRYVNRNIAAAQRMSEALDVYYGPVEDVVQISVTVQ